MGDQVSGPRGGAGLPVSGLNARPLSSRGGGVAGRPEEALSWGHLAVTGGFPWASEMGSPGCQRWIYRRQGRLHNLWARRKKPMWGPNWGMGRPPLKEL